MNEMVNEDMMRERAMADEPGINEDYREQKRRTDKR